MIERLARGGRSRIERDGTDESFACELTEFTENARGNPVAVFRLVSPAELVLDVRTGLKAMGGHALASDRYQDTPGFPDWPVPINLVLIRDGVAPGSVPLLRLGAR